MKQQTGIQPVTADHLAGVDTALKALSDGMAVINKMEACGEDCQHWRQMYQHYDAKLRKIKEVWGGQQFKGA